MLCDKNRRKKNFTLLIQMLFPQSPCIELYNASSNDILQLLNMSNKNEVKTIFHDIINTCENKNYNMNNKPNQNVVNNLLKYKNYLCYILPLLIVS